jgi:hypothetical protein
MNRLKQINYLNDVFYPASVILMESFWFYPWLLWLGVWDFFTEAGPAINLLSVIILLVASIVITRVVTRQSWPLWLIRTVVIGSGLVVMFLVLRISHHAGFGIFDIGWYGFIGEKFAHFFNEPHPMVLAIPVMIYLWWRGISLGRTTSQFKSIYTSFLTGMAFLILLIVLWSAGSGPNSFPGPGSEMAIYVIGFFFFGLVSIAVGHLYMMHRAMPTEEAALTSIWRWLPMMLGVIGGMIVIGFVIGSLFSHNFIQTLKTGVGYVGDAFRQIIEWIGVPLNWIFEGILAVLRWIIGMLRTNPPTESENTTGGGPFENFNSTGVELAPELVMALKWILIALIIGVIIFFLARTISRYLDRRHQDRIEEIHESLWNAREIGNDFRLFLKGLANKFRRKPKPGYPVDLFAIKPGEKMDVRKIYRHLLREGKRSGIPRRKHETVTEYARRLEKSIPAGTGPVGIITDYYTDVRYGDIGLQEKKVDQANTLWETVRNLLRSLRGA